MRPDRQCTATTRAGGRCRTPALHGGDVCVQHARTPADTLISDETVDRIVEVLRAGGYVETAAQVAGISPRLYRTWRKWGDPAGSDPRNAVYRRFRQRVDQAEAEAETIAVTLIAQAARTNWQAAAWMLERRYPESWARPSQRDKDAGGPVGGRAPIADADDPFAEVDELAQRRRQTGTE